MKRKTIITMAIILLVLFVSACNRDGPRQGAGRAGGAYTIQDPNLTPPGTFPIVREPVTISWGLQIFIQVADYYNNDLTRWFEDLTGVRLEFVFYDPGADGQTRLNLQVASGEPLPDVIFKIGLGNKARREAFGRGGAILPLNDYIEHLGYFTNQAVQGMTVFNNMGMDPWYYGMDDDGTIWGYMFYEQQFSNANSGRAWYNAEFAAALGMDESQWRGGANAGQPGRVPHFDWWMSYLRGVRDNDVNGNGIMNDEIPLTGTTGWRGNLLPWITRMFLFSDYSSTEQFWYVENDQLYYQYDQPLYRDAIRLMYQMYQERIWDESAITQSSLSAVANQEFPLIGFAVGGSGASYPRSLTYLPSSVVEGPNGYAANTYWMHVPQFPIAISSNARHPEVAFRLLDAQASDPDFAIMPRYGTRDVHWRLSLPHEPGLYATQGPNIGPVLPYMTEVVGTWGDNQTAHWRDEFGIDWLNRKSAMAWDGDEGGGEYRLGLAIQQMFPMTPNEWPINLVYTTAELDQWDQTRIDVLQYVRQSLALFATGQMNIERDWDSYLDTLRRMGYQNLLELDRRAYARLRSQMAHPPRPPVPAR
ncbi:MAG: hypothetical protein FWH12_01770 [Treponema sp.]|nr:hypothetical protein [Treponema sp.]